MTGSLYSDAYPHLFSPLRIGAVEVANRFVVPAVTTNFAEEGGNIGDRLIDYIEARAAGGFGMFITENLGVHASGKVMPRMGMADSDDRLPGLERLARSVRRHGTVLFGQISHAGRQTRSKITGEALVAPSALPCPLNREMPRELSRDQIDMLVDAYAAAAHRLQTAGFDGVEIHGAHGYLVAAFLSNYANHRQDEYGGSLDNRLRFLLRIIGEIRARCGAGFPIGVRISVEEFVPDGLVVEESCRIAMALEAAGVDTISASVGTYESFNRLSMITGEAEGRWLPLARLVRDSVSIPITGVGRLKRAEVAEEALRRGDMDMAAFGRASIADPDLPRKAREGREADTIWCIGCNICLGRSSRPQTICPVNPAVGDEASWKPEPANPPFDIRVEGDSFASLTAAWAAARRGHRVALVPGSASPGGMQAWRARVPGMGEYAEAIDALWRRAVAAGVRVSDGADERADIVWSELRREPLTPAIFELRTDAVPVSMVLMQADIDPDGPDCAVFGSDIAATEAAIRLATAGRRVRLVSAMGDVAHDAHPGYREISRRRLTELGVVPELHATDWRERLAAVGPGTVVVAGEVEPAAEPAVVVGEASVIVDAYEAGAMTAGIYAAARRAREVG